MGGLFLIGLLIVLFGKLWPFLLVALVGYLLWLLVIVPAREAQAREARDRLRHEVARREIDHIAAETSAAMYAAASRDGEVIEGTAVEVGPR